MELAIIAALIIGAGFGYKIGYSKGVKVNAPEGNPAPAPRDPDPKEDLR